MAMAPRLLVRPDRRPMRPPRGVEQLFGGFGNVEPGLDRKVIARGRGKRCTFVKLVDRSHTSLGSKLARDGGYQFGVLYHGHP